LLSPLRELGVFQPLQAGNDDPTRTQSMGTSTSAGTRFLRLRPYAKGGMGEVFVALDGELHREVALKEMQERHADRPESRARVVREAEITGGLEHPGIVPVSTGWAPTPMAGHSTPCASSGATV
jgi:hypothetical protein